MNTLTPIVRLCVDCQRTFRIKAREQKWFARRTGRDGLPLSLPKRCRDCRAIRKFEPRETRDRVAQIGR
jgi:hypothetical protein